MRMSLFFMLLTTLTVSANVELMSQRLSLDFKDATLREVLMSLKKQSGYMILYSNDELQQEKSRITLNMENVDLIAALDAVLKGLPYKYNIVDQMVMIIPAPEKTQQLPQQLTIKGRVLDIQNQPLAGVTVSVPGTTMGVATDVDGHFTLRVPQSENLVLRFSFIGKKEVLVTYTGQTNLVVRMEDADSEIEQVVVTGYQTISREKVTGAVNTITAEDLADRYTANLLDNLEGRVAGLMTYNGGMQIRGTGSIHAERSPLLVVDGLPVEGSIENLNPYDIESVTVLKDAAAAAIYGARASNGIIVVTTKRARQMGKVDVDVSANFTVYEKRNLDYHDNFYMNAREQVEAETDFYEYYFFDPETANTAISGVQSALNYGFFAMITPIQYAYYQLTKGEISREQLNAQLEQYKKNDFAREYSDNILRNRFLQQYNVAVRNRTENFSSNLVLNYRRDNTGMIKNSNDRFSAFYKGSYDMTPWLTVNFGGEMAFQKERKSNSEYAGNPFNVPAYMRLLNDDGSYNYYSATLSDIYHTQWEKEPGLRFNGFNHLEEMGYDRTLSKRTNTRLQGELLFRIIDGLTLNTMFIYEAERHNETTYSEAESYVMRMMRNAYTEKSGNTYTYLIPETGGMLETTDTRGDYWTARGQVNFKRSFGKHIVDVLAGLEFRQTYTKGNNGLLLGYEDQLQSHATLLVDFPHLKTYTTSTFYGTNYPAAQFFYTPYISSALNPVREQKHRYGSGYANITYTYDRRYNLFASYRSDYADVYGLDTEFRGKPLWSVGASWNINRENFMPDLSWVDMIKLRVSYGVTGNIYQGATSFLTASTGTMNSITGQPISVVESPANSELKWEQTATTNIGVDFALLNNRVRGSVDGYYKKGTDIFANKLLEDSKGFASMAMNAASLKNNGIEIALAADWFRAQQEGGFSWTTSATFAHNKNKITEVDVEATTANQLVETPYKVGYPVSAIFSFPYAGLADNGADFLYWLDETNTTTTISNKSPDLVVFSGQSDPKYNVGMENKFRFKGVSLNVMMVYYGGHKMRMRQVGPRTKNAMGYALIDKAYLNSWTPERTDTDVPGFGRYGTSEGVSGEYTYLDRYVQSGDFLKIRNIVLGYDLPKGFLSGIGLNRVGVNFQIDNPKALYIRNNEGVDPETGGVKKQTSYVFGLSISF